jgi:hypothetical protein
MGWESAMRGTIRVHLDALDRMAPADNRWQPVLAELSVSLADVRSRIDGDEGTARDGFGDRHEISVASLDTCAPDIPVVIWFSYQQLGVPDGLRGSIYPSDVLARLGPPA